MTIMSHLRGTVAGRLAALALIASPWLVWPAAAGGQGGPDADLPRQVEVIRTAYGVPHIYADNLRALGYALAYLQVEDYGERVPLGLLRARGQLASHQGRGALDSDFANRPSFTRAVQVYGELHEDTRSVYEGFAAGVNRYMAQHPEAFADWLVSPFTGYDVAALYVYRPSLGQARRWVRALEGVAEAPLLDVDGVAPAGAIEEGSSAWALAPSRTASGAAILLRNPHLSWEAGYWEAHVVVPGRLDFYGDFRIGAPLGIIGGFNRHLGFATTNNDVDNAQVYALEVDPDRADHYVLDGASIPIGRETMSLRFRNGDGYGLESRERLVTEFGPVIHRAHGRIYVLRAPEDGEFRGGEQFLRMIQATTLAEWTDAVRLRAHPRSNFTYADAEGNIFFLWNAAIPRFPHPYDEARAVPVTRRDQIWTALHELEDLPQLLNPVGGYLRNENDGPWLTNLRAPLDPDDYPDYFEAHEFSLRSQHAQQLIGGDERLSLEDVMLRKHSYRMLLADRVKSDMVAAARDAVGAAALDTDDVDPDRVASALTLLERWDNTAAPESRGGVLFQEWWTRYTEALDADADPARGDDTVEFFAVPWSSAAPTETPRGLANPGLAARVFPGAVAATVDRFGASDVAWGDVHRVRRGDVDVPVGGCPGRLGCYRVLNFREDDDGRRRAVGGDGWVLGVEFTSPLRAVSVLAYGQSSDDASPNYADQAAMFARGEMKEVAFTREDVERAAERRYRPGLE
ncbi:MAG: penicillin acylase family protein [Acidobacteria bacterium]|nr:penicillin acylase family protein [Acidobacteriota bacterium]